MNDRNGRRLRIAHVKPLLVVAALLLAGCATQAPGAGPADASAGWGAAVADCMTAAGYEGYEGDGEQLSYPTADGGVDAVQSSAFYACLARYPDKTQFTSFASAAQLDYVYDYFRDELIPCLTIAGYPVEGPVPSREEYARMPAASHWHPYEAIPPAAIADPTLPERCPPSPAGLDEAQF